MKGKVYKLSSENTDKCYIGSTSCKYTSVRLAHHREAFRKKGKDYFGLFYYDDDGKLISPKLEVLEEVEYTCDKSPLRICEQKHFEANKVNAINIRRCYTSIDQEKKLRKARIQRYHQSEKGKISLEKAALNAAIKRQVNPFKLMSMRDRIKFLEDKQHELRQEHGYRKIEEPIICLKKIDSPAPITFD